MHRTARTFANLGLSVVDAAPAEDGPGAETFRAGSDAFTGLEPYVASCGNGRSVEGVAVRH